VAECCNERESGRIDSKQGRRNPAEEAPWALRSGESPQQPRHQLPPTRWWCPLFLPERQTPSGKTGYRECFSRAAPCSPLPGARSAAMTPTSHSAPKYGDSTEGRRPALKACVRSGWRPTFSTNGDHRPMIKRSTRRPVDRLAASKGPAPAIGSGHWTRGDPLRASGWIPLLRSATVTA